MQPIATILRFPFEMPLRAMTTIALVVAWKPAVTLSVALAHASWHDAFHSFSVLL